MDMAATSQGCVDVSTFAKNVTYVQDNSKSKRDIESDNDKAQDNSKKDYSDDYWHRNYR